MRKFLGIGCLVFLSTCLAAQNIQGTVTDQISKESLVGAVIVLNHQQSGTVSDSDGKFDLTSLTPGLYTLQVTYIGYEPFHESEIWVKSGKTTFLEVKMNRQSEQMEELVITGVRPLANISSLQITEEKINRMAATYYDPARLIIASPDVSVTNDQNNQISVRGISPAYNVWRLEGVEIVNPNHLSNAGTFNDQPAATGGGVNMLSAQMLDRSQFHLGYMDNTRTNAVAGMFDMNMRKGYTGDHQFTGQASFIGFDFSAEGPLSKKHQASYLVNYRYSFTGLLGLMGVDFGGEVIGFQDLAFNVNVPLKKGASIKVFGFGGVNDNDFKAKTLEESEIDKDRSDIHFHGKMGAMGAKYEKPLGNNVLMNLTSMLSESNSIRDETSYLQSENGIIKNTRLDQSIWSNRINVKWNRGKSTVDFGSNLNKYKYDNETVHTYLTYNVQTKFDQTLISPYIQWQYLISKTLSWHGGVTYYEVNQSPKIARQIDYRGEIKYDQNNTSVSISAGKYSQLNQPNFAYVRYIEMLDHANFDKGFLSSYRLIASLQQNINGHVLQLTGFQYLFPDIYPVEYSVLPATLNGKTQGLSININSSTSLFYYDAGVTWLSSTYNDNRHNPFDIGHAYKASLGKKWSFKNNRKELSVNTKGMYQGGMYQATTDNQFKPRLGDYARMDLRVQWTTNKDKSTHTWAIDIQNMTNRQNEAYQYFDNYQGRVVTNYQLGLLPILTYRIEF